MLATWDAEAVAFAEREMAIAVAGQALADKLRRGIEGHARSLTIERWLREFELAKEAAYVAYRDQGHTWPIAIKCESPEVS
jgi:hypothetical protein